jgi:hypothetical protein
VYRYEWKSEALFNGVHVENGMLLLVCNVPEWVIKGLDGEDLYAGCLEHVPVYSMVSISCTSILSMLRIIGNVKMFLLP